MNESENLWNVDSLLKLSEDLQVENEQYRSLLAQKENQQLIEANRKLRVENEESQNIFKEAVTKTEEAKKILAEAKALNDSFDKRVMEKVSRVKRTIEADMKGRLQTALQKKTVTLSIWTWAFCFICMIQTGYILFMNRDCCSQFCTT